MYNFRIKSSFIYIFIADIVAMIILLLTLIFCVSVRANQFKKFINADKIEYCYINVTEKYGSTFGAITSIKQDYMGDASTIIADDTYSYVSFYKADGTDAIDSREKFGQYLVMNQKNAELIDIVFMLTALCFLLQFICLVTLIFSDKRFYYVLISMVPSILLACFYLSDKFFILYLSIALYLIVIALAVYEIIKIKKANYRILHRYEEQ